jgi:hypothetical protein
VPVYNPGWPPNSSYSYMTAIEILKFMPNVKLLAGSAAARGVHPPPTPPGYVRVSSTKRSGAADYHNYGLAIDLSAPLTYVGIRDMRLTASWLYGFSSYSLELIHKTGSGGYYVKNGQRVGNYFYNSATRAAHANHVHWAISARAANELLARLRAMYPPKKVDVMPTPAELWNYKIDSALYGAPLSAADLAKKEFQNAKDLEALDNRFDRIAAAVARIEAAAAAK